MQEKEVFLKKISNISIIFYIFIFLVISKNVGAKDIIFQSKIYDYINQIKGFKSNLIQASNNSIEEGSLYLKNKKLRIDYSTPSKIRIIITEKKAMYYNIDLQEVQYFDPRNTPAYMFFNMFYSKEFFNDASFNNNKNNIVVNKKINVDDQEYSLNIYFEKNPLLIRKIESTVNNEKTIYSIVNPDFNPSIDLKFFSLLNPIINNLN